MSHCKEVREFLDEVIPHCKDQSQINSIKFYLTTLQGLDNVWFDDIQWLTDPNSGGEMLLLHCKTTGALINVRFHFDTKECNVFQVAETTMSL